MGSSPGARHVSHCFRLNVSLADVSGRHPGTVCNDDGRLSSDTRLLLLLFCPLLGPKWYVETENKKMSEITTNDRTATRVVRFDTPEIMEN